MEDITDVDYALTKKFCKNFEKNIIVCWCISELLKYVSWNIWTLPAKFLLAPGLA